MEGVQRLAGGLAAATVINALMPNYALGQQVSRTDDLYHSGRQGKRRHAICKPAAWPREVRVSEQI
jgi:hypothetical protein